VICLHQSNVNVCTEPNVDTSIIFLQHCNVKLYTDPNADTSVISISFNLTCIFLACNCIVL
jgi:hypothetical protein